MDQKKLVTAMALVVTAIGAIGAIYFYLKLKKTFGSLNIMYELI